MKKLIRGITNIFVVLLLFVSLEMSFIGFLQAEASGDHTNLFYGFVLLSLFVLILLQKEKARKENADYNDNKKDFFRA